MLPEAEWPKTTTTVTVKIPPDVKYAVCLYGIQQDKFEGGGEEKAGLTFGPATGASYVNSYKSHEPSPGKKCIHALTWSQIAAQSRTDPTVFSECLENGCTHAVELKLNSKLKQRNYPAMTGDGAGVLYNSIQDSYRRWNGSAADTVEGSYKNAGGWPASRIRATLCGADELTDSIDIHPDTQTGYAGSGVLTETESLLSCFPKELQSAVVAKEVRSDTVWGLFICRNILFLIKSPLLRRMPRQERKCLKSIISSKKKKASERAPFLCKKSLSRQQNYANMPSHNSKLHTPCFSNTNIANKNQYNNHNSIKYFTFRRGYDMMTVKNICTKKGGRVVSATAIHIKDIDKHRTLFLVTGIEEADADLIADVEYTDIYPGGYVFYIQVYCPRYQTKICYNRFHSRAFLLKDKSALEEEFCDLDTMEEAAFDGVKRCKMTRDDVVFLKGNMPAEKIIRQRGDACV